MLSRYSNIRNEAKRKALAEVDRQRVADSVQRAKAKAKVPAAPADAPVANVAQTATVQ